MLSVSGARGIVGSTMTPAVAARFACAFGSHIISQRAEAHPLIILGRDSRPSGAMLATAAMAGLTSVGCRVIDLGVVATPTLGVMIDHLSAAGGMCITASHNPTQWNGLKSLDDRGVAPPPAQAQQIIERFHDSNFAAPKPGDIASSAPAADASAHDVHIRRVLACVNVEAIRAQHLRIVLDSINGAGCVAGRALLEALGCEVIHLNGEPTGHFAHTPEPIEENLKDLAHATRANNAAIGFAQDPDADRLAIVDEHGTYIGEEYTLALCALRMLQREKHGSIVANLSTSRMVDDIAAKFPGSAVHRSAVGEANVVQSMLQTHAIIGGEGNGGVILPAVTWVRDSLGSMALVLELLATSGRPLSSIIAHTLPRYVMIKKKVDLTQLGGIEAVPRMLADVRAAFVNEQISDVDGVRIDFEHGWVHLRPSNTEPIIRLIAEAPDAPTARDLIQRVAHAAGRGMPALV